MNKFQFKSPPQIQYKMQYQVHIENKYYSHMLAFLRAYMFNFPHSVVKHSKYIKSSLADMKFANKHYKSIF